LITLGIIGIVAALTIPQAIANYQERVIITKVKKIYAELEQITQTLVSEYGSLSFIYGANDASKHAALAAMYKPYFNIQKDCSGKGNTPCGGPGNSWDSASFLTTDNITYSFETAGPTIMVRIDNPKNTSWDINDPKYYNAKNTFYFAIDRKKNRIQPKKISPNYADAHYKPLNTPACQAPTHAIYRNCTAWMLEFDNMDFLHCPDDLSWDGAHSCKEAKAMKKK